MLASYLFISTVLLVQLRLYDSLLLYPKIIAKATSCRASSFTNGEYKPDYSGYKKNDYIHVEYNMSNPFEHVLENYASLSDIDSIKNELVELKRLVLSDINETKPIKCSTLQLSEFVNDINKKLNIIEEKMVNNAQIIQLIKQQNIKLADVDEDIEHLQQELWNVNNVAIKEIKYLKNELIQNQSNSLAIDDLRLKTVFSLFLVVLVSALQPEIRIILRIIISRMKFLIKV
jgi:hypothetical protein